MFWSRRNLVAIPSVVVVVAAGVWFMIRTQNSSDPMRALDEADQYELYSILPGPDPQVSKAEFHQYPVLGKISVNDQAARERLTNVLKAAARAGHGKKCFAPRHGIRVVKGETTTDFVICFECNHVYIWRNGDQAGGFTVGSTPQPVFDEILNAAGIQLAPSALELKK
jgi:hypothetical protein